MDLRLSRGALTKLITLFEGDLRRLILYVQICPVQGKGSRRLVLAKQTATALKGLGSMQDDVLQNDLIQFELPSEASLACVA